MDEKEFNIILVAAVNKITRPAFDLLQRDPHQWSTRPCPTCSAISIIIDRPFGCTKYALDKKANK